MASFDNKPLSELLTPLQIEVHDATCVAPRHGSEYCMLDGVMMTWIVGIEKIVVAHEVSAEKQGLGNWIWMDFNYKGGKSRMDSRRAAFWLHDFVNEFGVEQFQVINTEGEFQNKRIEILYRLPSGRNEEQIELEWADFINNWVQGH